MAEKEKTHARHDYVGLAIMFRGQLALDIKEVRPVEALRRLRHAIRHFERTLESEGFD